MELLFVIFIVLIGLIVFIKIKQNDTSVKRDTIEFDTQKSVAEITNALRSLNCQMMSLNYNDPLSNGQGPDIAVRCYGEPKFTDKFKHVGGAVSYWGVDVTVTDLGNRRHVELEALGQNVMGNTRDNKGFGMGFSREYRDKIAEMLA